eukprot:5662401-Alexandrium_andersonii.AAC.1
MAQSSMHIIFAWACASPRKSLPTALYSGEYSRPWSSTTSTPASRSSPSRTLWSLVVPAAVCPRSAPKRTLTPFRCT